MTVDSENPRAKRNETSRRRRLRLLRSDLADARNPKVLAKYPHLGNGKLIAQLEEAIRQLEGNP